MTLCVICCAALQFHKAYREAVISHANLVGDGRTTPRLHKVCTTRRSVKQLPLNQTCRSIAAAAYFMYHGSMLFWTT
jgi:hypothetical protein